MAVEPALQVRGGRELRRTLKRAGVDLGKLRAVNLKAAGVVVAATNPPRRTGRLAGTVRPGATQRAGIVRAGRASVPYAGPIHWGWPARNIRPNPFLVDAASSTEAAWTDLYWRELLDVLATIEGA